MKHITSIKISRESIPLKVPFITALRRVEETLFIRIYIVCSDGSVGIGEAPDTYAVTGENLESIETTLKALHRELLGLSPKEGMALLHTKEIGSSAKASVDIALMQLLGAFRLKTFEPIQTDITISLQSKENMLRDAQVACAQGQNILKVKLGKDIEHAIEVTELLQKELPHAELLIDANQAWSLESSLHYLHSVEHLDIKLLEQPVAAKEIEALKSIKDASNIPLLADEAAFTLEDVKHIVQTKSADMINIKLMKCGGMSKAIEILEYLRKRDVFCMLGSMLEGPYSINAALYLAFNYRDVIKYVDLDSPLLYKELPQELDFSYSQSSISPSAM